MALVVVQRGVLLRLVRGAFFFVLFFVLFFVRIAREDVVLCCVVRCSLC